MQDTGWFKSSHSSGANEGCVEVRLTEPAVHIRDSKNPAGPSFAVTPAAWRQFVVAARS